VALHRRRNLKLQNKRFRNIIHKPTLNDCTKILFNQQRVSDELVLVVHADSAAVRVHVLVLYWNEFAFRGFYYAVHIALQSKDTRTERSKQQFFGTNKHRRIVNRVFSPKLLSDIILMGLFAFFLLGAKNGSCMQDSVKVD